MTYSECEFVVETKNNHLSNVELIGYMDEARNMLALSIRFLAIYL